MSAKPNSADIIDRQKGVVFISYSKEDVEWRERVQDFLGTLVALEDAEVWADDRIDAGEDWYQEIQNAIDRSAIAVLLLTKDFLKTDFIVKEEVPELLRRRKELGMKLIPLLIHDCPWKAVRWLRELNIVPKKATPLDTMSEQEQNTFLSRMTEDIAEFLETWQEPAEPAAAEVHVTATVDISHLPETSVALFGRDAKLNVLDADWESPETRVVAFVAQGGMGKSALINRWLHDLQAAGWRGAERVFGWSFYSQGARDQVATAEMFIDAALRFFGDPDPSQGSAWDKGERLAGLVAAHRTLLVLDGMEPLQSTNDFERGSLRDPGLQILLRRLVRGSSGLCLISTREPIPDLAGRDGFRAVDLSTITPQDGRALLRSLRVVGSDAKLEALATEFGPGALSVTLLGAWLYEQPGHTAEAFINLPPNADPLARVLAGFEAFLGDGTALDLLRVQGLFDRPAAGAQVAAALDVAELDPGATARLRDLRLLATPSRHARDVLETHPLIREHYAQQLRGRFPDLFREGHRRLFEHLCETTEHQPDTLEDLQPLYQAVAHGCQAEMHQQVCDDVYVPRILRGMGHDGFHSTKKLGAIGADLGAVASFFDCPWSHLSQNLSAKAQTWLLHQAAMRLISLGRSTEAKVPLRATLELSVEMEDWRNAGLSAVCLSGLEMSLGEVSSALASADRSVTFGNRSGSSFLRIVSRAQRADTLHNAGRRDEARHLFVEAETMQAEEPTQFPRLPSIQGVIYCTVLLSDAECAAWQRVLNSQCPNQNIEPLLAACDNVTERETQSLEWTEQIFQALLDIALHHLTLARAALFRWLVEGGDSPTLRPCPPNVIQHLAHAVGGLRESGSVDKLPKGLLTRAWQRQLTGDPEGATSDLNEAWEIAERGPMPLFQTDILLTRARLFFRDDLDTARKNLAAARRLIDKHGYHRRDEELADAEAALRKPALLE